MSKSEVRFITELIPSDLLHDLLDESIEKSMPNLEYEWIDPHSPSSSLRSLDPSVLTGIVTASATVLASLITAAAMIILQRMKDKSSSQKEKLKVTIISPQGKKSIITSSGMVTVADLAGCSLEIIRVSFEKSHE
jgi:hypothetical protein